MNNDLISRSDLGDKLKKELDFASATSYIRKLNSLEKTDLVKLMLNLIDNSPTVSLPDFKEGYKGEWITGERNGNGYDYYCSRCMHITNEDINEIRYCPHCGADMQKGGA